MPTVSSLQLSINPISLILSYLKVHDEIIGNLLAVSLSFFQCLGYLLNNMPQKVLDLFDTMTVQPNAYTLSVIFRACGQVNNERAKKIGCELMNRMPNEFRNDIVLLNSVLSMLMNFHQVEKAEELFRSMSRKDVFSYGAMMQGKYLLVSIHQ